MMSTGTGTGLQLDAPHIVYGRLQDIERDLANRQGALESAARNWFVAKREREKSAAIEFLSADGTVAQRRAVSERQTATDGVREEAEWEALRAVARVLETRASICQSLLKVGPAH